jgi:succinylglutamate desuccinylase
MTQQAVPQEPPAGLPEAVRALAEADFSAVAQRWQDAGFTVTMPDKGILTVKGTGSRPAVLVSVGVHGDETGPIEMVAYLLDRLSRTPDKLAVDLMVCVGNVGAIAAGKRFIDADLNRMFRPVRGDLDHTSEARRADAMIRATTDFFSGAGDERWHLDLHTAIRPSVYPMFAIVPDIIAQARKQTLIGWLGEAAIEAIIMNPASAGTYSYYSAEHHGAAGTTIELGRVGTLGKNDMAQFVHASAALERLLTGAPAGSQVCNPHVFKVAQNIIKLSDGFKMTFGRDTRNFTAAPRGAVIATDGDTTYTVQHDEELVVFPNPDVRIGLRAGMMVTKVD